MEPNFYIDRQFGQAIMIIVDKGIVQKAFNGDSPKYDDKINSEEMRLLIFRRCLNPNRIANYKMTPEEEGRLKELENNLAEAKGKLEIAKGISKGVHGFDLDAINLNRTKLREQKYRT
jgi:hypothetical protein